ncbi:hypothetical protein BV25DRAFT_1920588 [Artomyces pyxidatus]|uniref:Uncharacterized protein n=1 Tax=Artomyces pyxidatus TaxID=48021 RepID=A0ACB8SM26_9AGAM|nr:hypothetical protein BV25DRAFT_1920588 [Artomyces pyxidatus]
MSSQTLQPRAKYAPLPQDDETIEKPAESKTYALIRWSTIVLLLCTVVDVFLVLSLVLRSDREVFSSTPASPTSALEMPNMYINFDKLYNGTIQENRTFPPIVNIPRGMSQVSSAQPNKVFPQWPESWLTIYGSVPINSRRLWVSPEVSTIVQFRVMDYGMENCSLVLTIPPAAENGTDILVSDLREDQARVDVWALSTSKRLDPQTLTWKTCPTRAAHVGMLAASYNETHELPSFACRSGSYQAFELSCAGSGCGLDITALNGQTAVGLYMRQYQTK